MVPDGWYVLPLGDLTAQSITYGVVKPGDTRVGGVPFIRGGDFPNGRINIDGLRTISSDISANYKRTVLKGGEILVSLVGYPGATTVVPKKLAGANIARQAALVRPNAMADRDYLYCFLRSHIGQRLMLSQTLGSAQQVINLKDLKTVLITLPPLPEQRKIADILSTWDQAIEKTEALLSNARTQKRTLMQQLLTGKRRFPAFEGQPWDEVRLGEMGKTISGGTPDSTVTEYWNGDINWATPTDITKLTSRFIHGTARKITAEGLKKSSAKMVDIGAILICTRATIGEIAIATGPICTNQGFKNLVLSDDFDSDFVFYLLQFFKKELIRYACGSTFLELSKKDFDKRSFNVPSLAEQQVIAAALNDAEAQMDEHARSIIKLRTEKKALMQQLLTGKRRVVI